MNSEPEWNDVLVASRRLQDLLPDAALVGGSATASHVGHGVAFDDDHVLGDLRERYDEGNSTASRPASGSSSGGGP